MKYMLLCTLSLATVIPMQAAVVDTSDVSAGIVPSPYQKISVHEYAGQLLQYLFSNDPKMEKVPAGQQQAELALVQTLSYQQIYFLLQTYIKFINNDASVSQISIYWRAFCKFNNYQLSLAPDDKDFAASYNPVGYVQAWARYMGASADSLAKMTSMKEQDLVDTLENFKLASCFYSQQIIDFITQKVASYFARAGHVVHPRVVYQEKMISDAEYFGITLPAIVDQAHIMDCAQAIAKKIGIKLPKTVLGSPLSIQQAFIIFFCSYEQYALFLDLCCKYARVNIDYTKIGLDPDDYHGLKIGKPLTDHNNNRTTDVSYVVQFLAQSLGVQIPSSLNTKDPIACYLFIRQVENELGLFGYAHYWSAYFTDTVVINMAYKDIPVSSGQLRWTDAQVTQSEETMACSLLDYAVIKNSSNTDKKNASFGAVVSVISSFITYRFTTIYRKALYWAIYYQNPTMVELLVQNFGDSSINCTKGDFFLQAVQDTPAMKLFGTKFNSTMLFPVLSNSITVNPFLYLMLMGNDSTQTIEIARVLYKHINAYSPGPTQYNITPLMLMAANAMNNTIADMATYVKFTENQLYAKNSQGFTAFDIANVINNNWRSGIFKNDSPSKQSYVNTAVALQKLHA